VGEVKEVKIEEGGLPGSRFMKYSLCIGHRIRKLACHEHVRAYLSHKRRLLASYETAGQEGLEWRHAHEERSDAS
jgi:hypothetical protein